jgi:hypothetical protein
MDMNTTVKKMVEVEEPLVTEWSIVDQGNFITIRCGGYSIFNVHASGKFTRIGSVPADKTGLKVNDNGQIEENK